MSDHADPANTPTSSEPGLEQKQPATSPSEPPADLPQEIKHTLDQLKHQIILRALQEKQASTSDAHKIRIADHVSDIWEQELPKLLLRLTDEASTKAQEIAEKTRMALPLYRAFLEHLEPALQVSFASMAPLKSDLTPTGYRNSPAEVAARTAADLAEAISFNAATALYNRLPPSIQDDVLEYIADQFSRLATPRIVEALTSDLTVLLDTFLTTQTTLKHIQEGVPPQPTADEHAAVDKNAPQGQTPDNDSDEPPQGQETTPSNDLPSLTEHHPDQASFLDR